MAVAPLTWASRPIDAVAPSESVNVAASAEILLAVVIPFVTVAHVTTGKFNVFCKIRAKDTKHAKEVIFMIDDIEGVYRTETMISLEESINDKKRLMHTIFKEL